MKTQAPCCKIKGFMIETTKQLNKHRALLSVGLNPAGPVGIFIGARIPP